MNSDDTVIDLRDPAESKVIDLDLLTPAAIIGADEPGSLSYADANEQRLNECFPDRGVIYIPGADSFDIESILDVLIGCMSNLHRESTGYVFVAITLKPSESPSWAATTDPEDLSKFFMAEYVNDFGANCDTNRGNSAIDELQAFLHRIDPEHVASYYAAVIV